MGQWVANHFVSSPIDMLYKNSTIHIKRKYQIYMEKYINNSLTA